MNFLLELLKSVIVPLVVGLGSALVTLHIKRAERQDEKQKCKDKNEDEQNKRIAALENKVGNIELATNENIEMNQRLLNGMSVLIDAGEINGTINGPGKQWLKATQEYVIQKGFQKMEIKSLSPGKKKANTTAD